MRENWNVWKVGVKLERNQVCIEDGCGTPVVRKGVRCRKCSKRNHYRNNKETYIARASQRNRDHPGEYKEARRKQRQDHPESSNAVTARRRGRASVGMTAEDKKISVSYRKAIANDPCFYCGKPGEHDDHYISIANGGTDHWWNIVRACAHCNISKGPRNGDEFLELEGA